MTVDKDTKLVALKDKVTVGPNTKWKLYRDALGYTEIPTKICAGPSGELDDGENVFYIIVTTNAEDVMNIYELDIYRSFMATISYYNNGKLFDTETVPTGYEHELIKNPTITGYEFYGWLQGSDIVEKITPFGDLEFTAKSTPKTYTVTLDPAGGKVETTELHIVFDSEYFLPIPTRENYDFYGWSYNDAPFAGDGIWTIGQDVTLVAYWELTEFNIVYELDGGTNSENNPTHYTVEDEIELEEPTKDRHVFTGWTLNGTPISKIAKGTTGDLTLVANWEVGVPKGTIVIEDEAYKGNKDLTTVVIPDTVTSIGKEAFSGCENLVSLSIPDSVTFIDDMAFYECTSLAHVTLGNGLSSIGYGIFARCFSLASIVIPDSVTSIGEYAFMYSGLASIVIGSSVTAIGERAFWVCYHLLEIINRSSLPLEAGSSEYGEVCLYAKWVTVAGESKFSIDDDGFGSFADGDELILGAYFGKQEELHIPSGVTSIAENAFRGCSFLASVTIPDSATSIGTNAFLHCDSLGLVTIGNGITFIGSFAFQGCSSLASVDIPDGVTSINRGVFSGCTSLASVAIPDSVTYIADFAFEGCSSLTSVTIPDGVVSIGDSAFRDCSSLEFIVIPDTVTLVGPYSFQNCSVLASAEIGAGVTSIGASAFKGCSSLTSVTIPDSVTSIYGSAFADCSSLEFIVIPDTVTLVGPYSFQNCSSLISAQIGRGVTSIGASAFEGCTKLADITFPGTIAEFKRITKGFRWKANTSASFVQCSDGVWYWD